jgi:hypothetical protein
MLTTGVCLSYVDKVLAVKGFGNIFREVVATLHRGATASFFPQRIMLALPITFSVQQGDPIAMLLYNIQLQFFLLQQENTLLEVSFPKFEEGVEASVDDVVAAEEDGGDLLIIDTIYRQFEAV